MCCFYDTVNTTELSVDDVVMCYGMRLRLLAHNHRSGTTWFTTEVLNLDEIKAEADADRARNVGNSQACFILAHILDANGDVVSEGWTVQGNELARWARIGQAVAK